MNDPILDLQARYEETLQTLLSLAGRVPETSTGKVSGVTVEGLRFLGDTAAVGAYTYSDPARRYATRVALFPSPSHRCTCPDWTQRRHACKHVAAVLKAAIVELQARRAVFTIDRERLAELEAARAELDCRIASARRQIAEVYGAAISYETTI